MSRTKIILAFLTVVVCASACKKIPRSGKVNFKSSTDSLSYALGYIEANSFKKNFEQAPFQIDSIDYINIAKAIAKTNLTKRYSDFRIKQFDELNEEAFYKGFVNELAYGKSYFSELSADIYLRKIFEQKKIVKDSLRKEQGKTNLLNGKKFLEKNKKRKEITTTESGLQYEILKKGTGKKALATDKVKCVYHGTLLDGSIFDSSKERGDTTTFGVRNVIKGWTEALKIMPEGSEWRIYIPSELAYGEQGKGEKIGPNETLIFDLNLIKVIEKKKK